MTSKNFNKILYGSLFIVTMMFAIFGIDGIIAEDEKITTDKTIDPNQKIILQIDSQLSKEDNDSYLKEKYLQKYFTDSKDTNALGNNWQVVSVDYAGSQKPFSVDDIIITARLIDDPNNFRQCQYGTEAIIIVDVNTGKIKYKKIPTVESKCVKPIQFSPPQGIEIPDFIPQADGSSNRAYLIAGQEHSSGHYGGYGKIKIPTFDESDNPDSIYNKQDGYIGYLYNQMINGKFFQVGFTATSSDSSLGPAGKYLIYIDQNTFGNYNGHEISGITWSNNGDATVYIQCGSFDDYYIYMNHNGAWFAHDTNYNCNNVTDNNTTSNSVFLENTNTVPTSEWSDEIVSSVTAWNMREFDTKYSTSYWDSSSNTFENCPSGIGSTVNISGSLALGGSSVWSVSGIDDC